MGLSQKSLSYMGIEPIAQYVWPNPTIRLSVHKMALFFLQNAI